MRSREEKISFIREKCVAVNPAILDLKMGCQGIWHKSESENTKAKDFEAVVLEETSGKGLLYLFTTKEYILKGAKNLSYRTVTIFSSDFTSIGRDIRFTDIILALSYQIEEQGDLAVLGGFAHLDWGMNGSISWDLSNDNLDRQLDGTIESLEELLS